MLHNFISAAHFLPQTSISFYIYHSHSSAQIPKLALQTLIFTFNFVGFKCCYFSLLNQQITYRLTSENVSLISEIFSNSIGYPFTSRFGKACSMINATSEEKEAKKESSSITCMNCYLGRKRKLTRR